MANLLQAAEFELVVSTLSPFTSDTRLFTHCGRLALHAFHATFDFHLLTIAVIVPLVGLTVMGAVHTTAV